jgi:Lipocalin-like domain
MESTNSSTLHWEFFHSEEGGGMKRFALFLFIFALCATAAYGQTELEIRDRIVGTWKLVSAEETMKDGTTHPFPSFGRQARGFLMYERDGYMCAELMNPDRPKSADPLHATAAEKAAAAEGAFAYCGRYEIEVRQRWIVHLPEAATDTGYVGSRQIRPFT